MNSEEVDEMPLADETEWLVDRVDSVMSEAEYVLKELDPFTNGEFPEIWSAVNWLLPLVHESRNWCSNLESAIGLFDDDDDNYTPVTAMELLLAHYGCLKSSSNIS